MTSAVDWALKTNYLSYLLCWMLPQRTFVFGLVKVLHLLYFILLGIEHSLDLGFLTLSQSEGKWLSLSATPTTIR